MSVYSISSINVKDWDAYAEYMKLVPAVIKKYGGKYLVRGGEIISDNTTWNPQRIVILEFPTIAAIRIKASDSESFVVQGI